MDRKRMKEWLFSSYFSAAPVIQVPGRLYPIQLEYTPPPSAAMFEKDSRKSSRLDPTPYLRILQRIDHKYPSTERGDLLIFLSGMNEITQLMEKAKEYALQTKKWIVLPLHSSLSIEEQDKVFDVSPDGVRKCIISTNIAETSVTIDGVRFIVDSGKVKEMGYDAQIKMRQLQEFWISKASAEQRKGRAGRTGPGVCFRMYSESDYDAFESYSTPEIHRAPLNSLLLQIMSLKCGDPRKFPFIEPPNLSSIEMSIAFLKDQGALTEGEELSAVGHMLSQLPVDEVIGKILIMGTMFHVVEPVLTVAAALTVQSPFARISLNQGDIAAARRSLESDHGDAFTLLNAYNEWLQVKSEGSSASFKWCKRRKLEQQRLYEMTKLRQQFLDILQEAGLLPRDYSSRMWDTQSEDVRRELKQLRKQNRVDQRKRKVLKFDGEGGAQSDDEEAKTTPGEDLKHLEFKLFHNLSRLQESSAIVKNYTSRDINILKIVISSGIYPQFAIADECNSWKRDSEQVFHTKAKSFVVVHPSSVFSSNPEALEPKKNSSGHTQHELLTYVDLLETNKPYLVNNTRVPTLATLLLFGKSLDTNQDFTRIIVDHWLEVKMSDPTTAREVVSTVQDLRNTWSNLLQRKLTSQQSKQGTASKVSRLEEVLSRSLSEFLNTSVEFSVSKISSQLSQHLYRGPSSQEGGNLDSHWSNLPTTSDKPQPTQHPLKGGVRITDYLTFDCLETEETAVARSAVGQVLQRVWTCSVCKQTLALTMAEQLLHKTQCSAEELAKSSLEDADSSIQDSHGNQEDSMLAVHRKEYYCTTCCETLNLSTTEILKHKISHQQSS